jgi:hypothetical protein
MLHEAAEVPYSIDQIQSCMYQVAKTSDELRHILLFYFTVMAQFEPLLHGRLRRIAVTHSSCFQDVYYIMRLTQPNPAGTLFHLQSKIECQQLEVCHLELCLHFLLESPNFIRGGPCDDQVIDIHPDDQLPATTTSAIDGVLMLTLSEPKLVECCIKLHIPCPRRLVQPIQSTPETKDLVFFSNDGKSLRLLDVCFFYVFPIEKRNLDIHVVHFPSLICY